MLGISDESHLELMSLALDDTLDSCGVKPWHGGAGKGCEG